MRRKFALVMLLVLGLGVSSVRADEPPGTLGYPTARYPEAPPAALLSPADASRLRTLDNDLKVLAELGESRVLDGSLSLAAGCAFLAIGAFFIDDAFVRTLLAMTGGVAAGRGVIALTAVPEGAGHARAFSALPMTTAQEVAARLLFGEAALGSLAKRTRQARLWDGSLSMLAGAAFMPAYLALRRREEPGYRFAEDPADYIGIAVSAISVASGVVAFVRKSEAEKRHAAYVRLRDSLSTQARTWAPTFAVHLDRQSAHVAMQLRF